MGNKTKKKSSNFCQKHIANEVEECIRQTRPPTSVAPKNTLLTWFSPSNNKLLFRLLWNSYMSADESNVLRFWNVTLWSPASCDMEAYVLCTWFLLKKIRLALPSTPNWIILSPSFRWKWPKSIGSDRLPSWIFLRKAIGCYICCYLSSRKLP